MGKHSDDEIPLTHTTSNITRETRARFDSLLRDALDREQGSPSRMHQKQEDNVEEVGKFPKKQMNRSIISATGTDRQSSRKSSSRKVEESPFKPPNTSTQMFSSGFDFLSSSDDDVVMKERLNGHLHKDDKDNSRKNSNKNTEQLVLDKRLKNERNSSEISHQKEVKIYQENNGEIEADVIRKSSPIKSIQSVSIEEYADYSQAECAVTLSRRNSEHVKKPVPLPRSRTQKKFSDTSKMLKKEIEQSIPTSASLSPLFHLDQLADTKIAAYNSSGDDDSVRPQKVERKKEKKNDLHNDERQEHIELKNIKTTPGAEVEGKEDSSSRKSSFHKSRIKSREVVAETALTTGEAHQTEFSYDKIVGIFIHRSEILQVDPLVRHPLVKVHLLDATTGSYLKKSNSGRSVSFYYENEEVDYILPLMTEAFDYKERRCIVPFWEELLVFNEDFEYILQDCPPVIILFEILDFVNFTVASSRYQKLGSEGGWHHVAWAFLKPVGANGILNTEKQVRLQLYKSQRTQKASYSSCAVYEWWSGGVWERYPATLYITVKGITPPEHLPRVLRSQSALQGELSQSPSFSDMDQNPGDARSENENSMMSAQLLPSEGTLLPAWYRLPSQSCKIPNRRKLTLPSAPRGCFVVKFSNSGLHLACSLSAEEKHFIAVYSIPDGKEFAQFWDHQGLVYDLQWSPKDTMLLSASADCTACLWDTDTRKSCPIQILPHPSFVYCAQFHPGNSSVLVTGCCDHVVRVWNRPHRSSQFELVQELEGHLGFISAVAMGCNGLLYSADSIGRILEWTGSKVKSKKQTSQWKLSRNMDIRELRDTVVNRLQIHPGGQRLLIHTRDSRLRMLDIVTASVIQWFNGALNHRVQTSACLSPCGGLVLAGSEDSTVRVWNTDTGEQLAIYSGLQFHRGASGVDYHPYEHMVAFSSYGSPAHIVVCDYEKLGSGKDLGLQMLVQQDITSLKGTLQSTTGDFTNSCLKSSTPLGLELQSLKKKKKVMPMNSEVEVSQGSPRLATYRNLSSLSLNSTIVASPWKENDSETSKARLASIIEKMDQVLSRTPSKISQQISESFNPRLSDASPVLSCSSRRKKKRESVSNMK